MGTHTFRALPGKCFLFTMIVEAEPPPQAFPGRVWEREEICTDAQPCAPTHARHAVCGNAKSFVLSQPHRNNMRVFGKEVPGGKPFCKRVSLLGIRLPKPPTADSAPACVYRVR